MKIEKRTSDEFINLYNKGGIMFDFEECYIELKLGESIIAYLDGGISIHSWSKLLDCESVNYYMVVNDED